MSTRVQLAALAALLLCLTQSACKRGGDPAQLAAVDSLQYSADSLMNALASIDVNALKELDSIYLTQQGIVSAHMRDTVSKSVALALGNYHRAMTKSMGRALNDRDKVMRDLETSDRQLTDLRHDIEVGAVDANMAATYIAQERLHLRQTLRNGDIVAAHAATVFRDHGKYRAVVDSVLAADSTRTP